MLQHPTLRLIAVVLLFLGAHNASLYPYQSLIAIERIGMGTSAFSLMLVLASLIAVTSSVMFGVLGDQYGRRRLIALVTALASTIGVGLMLAFPGIWALILCQGVLLPLTSSLYGQLFALARLASPGEGARRDAVLSTIRSALSFSFLAVLIFRTFAFGFGLSVLAVYVSGGVASVAMSCLVFFGWPKDGQTPWAGPRSGMRMRDALAEIAKPNVAVRVFLLGALASAGNLYMILFSLVFNASHLRGPTDVALHVRMVAGCEVPAMLILPRFAHRLPRATVMAIGALLYGVHLLALPILADTPYLWILPIFARIGGAVIITSPISYYQDLLRARPGAAAAILAVQNLVADVMTATIFAIGSQIGGFEIVAVMGVAVSLCGALGVYFADRHAWFPARV